MQARELVTMVRQRSRNSRAIRTIRRKRRVVNYRRAGLMIIGLELILIILLTLFTSSIFYITQKRVIGNVTVPTADIVNRMKLPPKANIFLIHKKVIVARILANPVIKSVALYRKPPGTLIARVVERKPYAILDTGAAKYFVDSTGLPFRVASAATPGLPTISYPWPKDLFLGKPVDAPVFGATIETLRLCQQYGITSVRKITVDQNNDLCLNVRDKYEVRLGQPERLLVKIKTALSTERKPGVRWSRRRYPT